MDGLIDELINWQLQTDGACSLVGGGDYDEAESLVFTPLHDHVVGSAACVNVAVLSYTNNVFLLFYIIINNGLWVLKEIWRIHNCNNSFLQFNAKNAISILFWRALFSMYICYYYFIYVLPVS